MPFGKLPQAELITRLRKRSPVLLRYSQSQSPGTNVVLGKESYVLCRESVDDCADFVSTSTVFIR
ncbi:MAG: hypothetical protein ACLRXC_11055 [[Clostridium] leptum]